MSGDSRILTSPEPPACRTCALLAALNRNLARFQIALRQIRRQHGVFPRQRRHGVDMLDNKLAVRDPQFHIRQIVGIESGFLHCLI